MAETTSSEGSGSGLPEVITRYQRAHDRRDTDAALSAFGPDARVVDDGQEFVGTDEVRTWLNTAASQFTFTRTLLRVEEAGADTWVVSNRLEGDFPGGAVELRYRFGLTDGLISQLVIAP